jgi:two-component system sensor histidine kinase HydH
MMLVAAVSWGMSVRYERVRRRMEHERRLSLLGQMSAVMAHEIRNPLTSLKGHAQLLAESLETSSPSWRKADRIVRDASRLEALTSDLLDFVRSGPLDRSAVDPRALLKACAEDIDAEAFVLETENAPAAWRLDRTRVRQILTNLLRNAQQASPEGSELPLVRLYVEDGLLVVTVRDHGEGLPKGEEERIFEPFFTTRSSGTGLGLAVARRIVELHGGTLEASNHPSGGAIFRLAIPAERT